MTMQCKNNVNWKLISQIDPILLKNHQQKNLFTKLVHDFPSYVLTDGDSQILQHPLAIRFFQLTKIIVNLYIQKIDSLKKEIQYVKDNNYSPNILDKEEEVKQLKLQIKILKKSEKCPICHKLYRSHHYLNQHIQNHHNNIVHFWKILEIQSINYSNGINDNKIDTVEDQVLELKKEISFLHSKIDSQNQQIKKLKTELSRHNYQPNFMQGSTCSAYVIQPLYPPGPGSQSNNTVPMFNNEDESFNSADFNISDFENTFIETAQLQLNNLPHNKRIRKKIEKCIKVSLPSSQINISDYSESSTSNRNNIEFDQPIENPVQNKPKIRRRPSIVRRLSSSSSNSVHKDNSQVVLLSMSESASF